MGSKLKTNFKVQNRYGAFYTGGKVQFSKNGDYMLCQNGDQIQILEVKNGQTVKTIGQEGEDEVTSFVLSPDDKILVVAGKSLLLRQYDWRENTVTRTWKAIHMSPVSCMSFDVTSTLLATGGSDSTIKVWDVIKQYCTHNLKGHSGVISVAEFHPDIERLQLVSAGEDYKLRVWDLRSSTCLSVLEHHFSVITAIDWTKDLNTLFCGSRDNTVSVWNLETYAKKKTIPVYEGVEGLVVVPPLEDHSLLGITSPDHVHFITAGAKGSLKVWDSITAHCVYTLDLTSSSSDQSSTDQAVTSLLYNKTLATLSVVTYDHNILMYKLQDFSMYKQFVGYNDEILDVRFLGAGDTHLAVASNSELLKVFSVETWDCQILRGHTDTVMSLDVNRRKNCLASASKDNSVRVWYQDKGTGAVTCVAVGQGHTNSVLAVALSRLDTSFLVSGSQDLTLKLWPLPSDLALKKHQLSLRAEVTEKAHDKDINAIVVSPNDKLIATGSQDKTAKLWKGEDLTLLGVFRGHKRGVWCVQFSPVDQCIATSSADGSVKIWALSDFSCVKTFEGHDCSVLKVTFLSRGMQLLSTGSDGLLKLWTIKSSECVQTFDEHEDKAWALDVTGDETTVVTGGSDSTLLVWKDVTVEEQEEARQKQEEFILKEQELQNLLHHKKYLKALGLAISLDQPFRVLSVIKDILSEETGKQNLDKTISKLADYQIDSVLRYVSTWNTNSKHCFAAQSVLTIILRTYSPDVLLKLPNCKSSLEGLLPYTERHFARLRRLEQQTTFVDYTWQCMRPITDYSHIQKKIPIGNPVQVKNGDQDISSSDSSDEEEADVKAVKRSGKFPVKKDSLKNSGKSPVKNQDSSTSSGSSSEADMDINTVSEEKEKSVTSKVDKSNRNVNKSDSRSPNKSETRTKENMSVKKVKHEVGEKEGNAIGVSECISTVNFEEKSDSGCEASFDSASEVEEPVLSSTKKKEKVQKISQESVVDSEVLGHTQHTPTKKEKVKKIKDSAEVTSTDKVSDFKENISENIKNIKRKVSPSKKRQKVKDHCNRKRSRSGSLESKDGSNSEGDLEGMTLIKVKDEFCGRRTRSRAVKSEDASSSELDLNDMAMKKFKGDSFSIKTGSDSLKRVKTIQFEGEPEDVTLKRVKEDAEGMGTEECEADDGLKTPYTTFKLTGRTPRSTGRIGRKLKMEDGERDSTYTDPGTRTRAQKLKKSLRPKKLKSTKK